MWSHALKQQLSSKKDGYHPQPHPDYPKQISNDASHRARKKNDYQHDRNVLMHLKLKNLLWASFPEFVGGEIRCQSRNTSSGGGGGAGGTVGDGLRNKVQLSAWLQNTRFLLTDRSRTEQKKLRSKAEVDWQNFHCNSSIRFTHHM